MTPKVSGSLAKLEDVSVATPPGNKDMGETVPLMLPLRAAMSCLVPMPFGLF